MVTPISVILTLFLFFTEFTPDIGQIAPMVYQRENNGSWTAYNIGRDYLGSITHVATADGTPIEENSYNPWGRLRNPESLTVYQSGSEPELFLGRGFTGHEHLGWFGLVNMNARLYDPLLGRFLSPDPYVQAPDFTQNFNRYSYALNNPLKYTDESGELLGIDDAIIAIAGAALLGGGFNLAATWKKCEGVWEHIAAFFVGAFGGAAVAATGGAAAVAGGGVLATAGVVGVGAVSGATTGATNNIIAQTGENFKGIGDIDGSDVWKAAIAGGVAGGAGAGVGIAMAGVNIPVVINGTKVYSPVISSFLVGGASSGAGHIAGGTAAGMLYGASFEKALASSMDGLGASILLGGTVSATTTAVYDIAKGINPLNGKEILVTAKDLGITEQEIQHVKNVRDGESGVFYHDGSIYYNKEGILPNNTTYTEYVIPRPGGLSPAGTHRIIIGADGSWYYTPDHHITFYKFKP